MDEKPLVSVIMGAYNCEKTINSAIDSIIAQSYDNWELIICDDCSSDSTVKILKEYENKNSKIRILQNEKNLRLAATLNRCLVEARGKYIARMDADDECLPNRLEIQISFLESHLEIDVVGCGILLFNTKGVFGRRCLKEFPQGPESWSTTPFAHPTIVMKKEIYDILNGYTVSKETMRAEDLDLWFRFYERGFRGYNLQTFLYMYRESSTDYKKRSLKAAFLTAKLRNYWHRKLKISHKFDYLILKPVVSAIIPNYLNFLYHKVRS